MLPKKKSLISEFAKSYGLHRAKERAKRSQSNSSPDHRFSANRTLESTDALCDTMKLSQLTDSPMNSIESEVKGSGKALKNLRIHSIDKHFSRAGTIGTIWDQEFPSMCSYGSDYDPLKSPGLLSQSMLETPKFDLECLHENSNSCDENLNSCVGSCCNRGPSQVDLNSGIYQNDEKIGDGNLHQQDYIDNYPKAKIIEKKRRGRNNISISASIPADVQGVIAESVAIVKISCNPYEDFRRSVVAMIIDNNLGLEDLEDLLYCYLCLNSPEHYGLIRESFLDACDQLTFCID